MSGRLKTQPAWAGLAIDLPDVKTSKLFGKRKLELFELIADGKLLDKPLGVGPELGSVLVEELANGPSY